MNEFNFSILVKRSDNYSPTSLMHNYAQQRPSISFGYNKYGNAYLEERKEKEELYQKHNIPYIGIEADDPKKDTLTFTDNLKRQLISLAEKHYHFVPEYLR